MFKWLNGNGYRIDSKEDAPPRTGGKESTPRRTRTFNPLIKSQPDSGPGDTGRADSGERVCGSVSETTPPTKQGKLADLPQLLEQLTPELQGAFLLMLKSAVEDEQRAH